MKNTQNCLTPDFIELSATTAAEWEIVKTRLGSGNNAGEAFQLNISANIETFNSGNTHGLDPVYVSPNSAIREVYTTLLTMGFEFSLLTYLLPPGTLPAPGFIHARIHRLPHGRRAQGFISPQMKTAAHGNGEIYVTATEDLPAFAFLIDMSGKITSRPSRYTMQISENEHIDSDFEDFSNEPEKAIKPVLSSRIDNFFDHSCSPNCRIEVFRDFVFLRSIRQIKAGESISFNYLGTEWDMFSPFECYCGAKNCFKNIRGFRHLSLPQQQSLRHLLTPFLLQKLKEAENL